MGTKASYNIINGSQKLNKPYKYVHCKINIVMKIGLQTYIYTKLIYKYTHYKVNIAVEKGLQTCLYTKLVYIYASCKVNIAVEKRTANLSLHIICLNIILT